MGTKTQEPDAQDAATSSVSNNVAKTQEPATHSVVETQEPTIADRQKIAMDETQEPAADIELQEPEAQTSSISNKVVETQEPTTHPVAKTQEPTADIEIEL
jgi:hypothetical protein